MSRAFGWMGGGGKERNRWIYRCIRTLLVRIRIRPAATRSAGYTDVPGDAGDAGGLPGLPSLDPLIWHDPDRNSPRVLVLVFFLNQRKLTGYTRYQKLL